MFFWLLVRYNLPIDHSCDACLLLVITVRVPPGAQRGRGTRCGGLSDRAAPRLLVGPRENAGKEISTSSVCFVNKVMRMSRFTLSLVIPHLLT